MKAAMLTRYGRTGASSRLRTMQYLEYFQTQGVEASIAPFFDQAYLDRLYSGGSTLGSVVEAYRRRVTQLSDARCVDLVWIEKEALPWLPWMVESKMLPARIPRVVDYDDAVFHRYDMHRSVAVRRLLGRKLDQLMASASLVTAGNSYLAERAEAAGAPHIEIVPTVVDTKAYRQRPRPLSDHQLQIGWIGSPSTWTEYMVPMMPLLRKVAEDCVARMLVVGAGPLVQTSPLFEFRSWSEHSEVALIHEMDIGIMPLNDTPWARGKCGYKLIQYMACGLPVIASPAGVNTDIIEHGVNGFLASTEAEWTEALQILLGDPDLRTRMGEEGRRRVERDYSLQTWAPRLIEMLRIVASQGHSS